jgi:DNA-binding FadR family transcriptional regulator
VALPTTFERVYAILKERLRSGAFHPGERLEPAMLSEQLNASVTPVRDALHRLTGERLVDAPRHEGFRVPMLTESMLRHLYDWHLDLLLIAVAKQRLRLAEAGKPDPADAADGALERQQTIFFEVAAASGNPEHLIAFRALRERLQPYESLADQLLDAIEPETEAIANAVHAADRRALRKSLIAYHRRRHRIVPELLDRAQ